MSKHGSVLRFRMDSELKQKATETLAAIGLSASGADTRAWNRQNDLPWTPLRIATGVRRGMDFRYSPETAAIREVR